MTIYIMTEGDQGRRTWQQADGLAVRGAAVEGRAYHSLSTVLRQVRQLQHGTHMSPEIMLPL